MRTRELVVCAALAVLGAACGGNGNGDDVADDDGDDGDDGDDEPPAVCIGVDCSGHGECFEVDGGPLCQCDGGYVRTDATTCELAVGPTLGGCNLFPANHLFNTPIDALPTHDDSDAFIDTIGRDTNIHLDLGTETDQQSDEYYGIPYNVVSGESFAWPEVAFFAADPDMDWDPRPESDCATGTGHTFVQPCTEGDAPAPLLPIPGGVLVEGGVNSSSDQTPYGDHHILLVDSDQCMLWEVYHAYSPSPGEWNIFGSAGWDLGVNTLRPEEWTSADAAGFPILPLLIRADEASTGEIRHALRFTIETDSIRTSYVWPARHLTSNGTDSEDLPPMGQAFRLKSEYVIPGGASTQARAILQAMKTYGMYIADGGSDMYVTGEPSGAWDDDVFDTVQSLTADDFEAVDLSPIMDRDGWSEDSATVP